MADKATHLLEIVGEILEEYPDLTYSEALVKAREIHAEEVKAKRLESLKKAREVRAQKKNLPKEEKAESSPVKKKRSKKEHPAIERVRKDFPELESDDEEESKYRKKYYELKAQIKS